MKVHRYDLMKCYYAVIMVCKEMTGFCKKKKNCFMATQCMAEKIKKNRYQIQQLLILTIISINVVNSANYLSSPILN